jgi:shikimate dehydrogenase
MPEFGLIGKSLDHSFSPAYFGEKFKKLGLTHTYEKFELQTIEQFPDVPKQHPELIGLNVTIPYKESIIPFLDELSPEAKEVEAVNTIAFSRGKLKGYNTDIHGFDAVWRSLYLRKEPCLVLGTGGASKAVVFVLKKHKVPFLNVSRNPTQDQIGYDEISTKLISEYPVIVNTTPLGMYPDVKSKPKLPYAVLDEKNVLIDLVYEPGTTAFLHEGLRRGARIKNGFQMLVEQAEASWNIWTAQH